jgi:hypothetical protein
MEFGVLRRAQYRTVVHFRAHGLHHKDRSNIFPRNGGKEENYTAPQHRRMQGAKTQKTARRKNTEDCKAQKH